MIGLLFLALAAASVAEEREDARTLAEAAAVAWNEGRLGEAGTHAAAAYDALVAEGCLATRDGARLAFMAGVAGLAGQSSEPQSYFFWAADQLNEAAGGLTTFEREVARDFGVEPGLRPAADTRHARSPFLETPRPRRARGCARVLPALNPDPPAPEAGVLFARTMNPSGAYTRPHPVYAYPESLRTMAPQIQGTYDVHRTITRRSLVPFVFNPCLTVRDAAGERSRLCLESAPAP
jgi:hypothetical protein